MAHKHFENHPKRTPKRALALVPNEIAIDPHPDVFRLNSMGGVRREMIQIYKLARTGELPLPDACKYGFLLSTLAKLSESELLEDRLARLE